MYKLRTEKMLARLKAHYDKSNGEYNNFLKQAPVLKSFKYWNIVNNNFPYDMIAKIHHILVPKRILIYEEDLDINEYAEFLEIKKYLDTKYDIIIENLLSSRSIPGHYHLHLIKLIK